MTMDHVAKIGDLILPVHRTLPDGSLVVGLPEGGKMRYIPRTRRLIGTERRTGKIFSAEVGK